ncbi:hypothetical protein WMY93_014754 [Mugilogobius chulae]|uniref:Uncharacterized protein n=1 Tax=Mugilogobius chulae TaxID=88201 RepID=A0AAW0P7G1_9GOBI
MIVAGALERWDLLEDPPAADISSDGEDAGELEQVPFFLWRHRLEESEDEEEDWDDGDSGYDSFSEEEEDQDEDVEEEEEDTDEEVESDDDDQRFPPEEFWAGWHQDASPARAVDVLQQRAPSPVFQEEQRLSSPADALPAPSSPPAPRSPPVGSALDFVPLCGSKRHRTEDEEEEPSFKRQRSEDSPDQPSTSAGTSRGFFIRNFHLLQLSADAESPSPAAADDLALSISARTFTGSTREAAPERALILKSDSTQKQPVKESKSSFQFLSVSVSSISAKPSTSTSTFVAPDPVSDVVRRKQIHRLLSRNLPVSVSCRCSGPGPKPNLSQHKEICPLHLTHPSMPLGNLLRSSDRCSAALGDPSPVDFARLDMFEKMDEESTRRLAQIGAESLRLLQGGAKEQRAEGCGQIHVHPGSQTKSRDRTKPGPDQRDLTKDPQAEQQSQQPQQQASLCSTLQDPVKKSWIIYGRGLRLAANDPPKNAKIF